MFYIINNVCDLMLFFLGMEALRDKYLICANHNYLLVYTEIGALYMLFHTLTILVYSFLMYHIFYRLPLKYNLISYKKRGQDDLITTGANRIKVTGSMANQDAYLDVLIQIDQEDRVFQKKQADNREIEYSRDGSITFKPSAALRAIGGPSPTRRDENNSSIGSPMSTSRRAHRLSEAAR
jgi:hypothetical protein